jgi:3-oxoacyl-[acyl-carrier-protein] synthase III
VKNATNRCIGDSTHRRNEIDYIIHVSNYRAKEIVEPAMAVVIQRAAQINSETESSEKDRTLSFDLMNGSVGFLQAVQVLDSFISTQKAKVGLVVSGNTKSHIGTVIEPHLGFCEVGVAALVDSAPDARRGFSDFYYCGFPEFLGDYESYVYFREGEWFSRGVQSPDIIDLYIQAAESSVNEYLRRLGRSIRSFDVVIAQQITPAFISKTCTALGGEKAKFIDLTENNDDLQSASIPVGLKYIIDNGLIKEGNQALLMSVGSGIQVGCATYTF